MEPGMILHLLRNPWGHSDDEVRQARLAAADELERWRRTVDHPGSAVQWIAEMQPQLTALRARVAEAVRMIEGYKRAGLLTNPATAEQATDFISRATGNKAGSRE